MPSQFSVSTEWSLYQPHFNALRALYKEMDAAYEKIATAYGFECRGCPENCCLTRFHHHTFIEYAYLIYGVRDLADLEKKNLAERADAYNRCISAADAEGTALRRMCPANVREHCILYAYRPMICRLHGIPHELARPGKGKEMGPGCEAFMTQCRGRNYIPFDRTPFYVQMARLEKGFRQGLGGEGKIKQTIAQMLSGAL